MRRPRLDRDIKALSDFRAHLTKYIRQVQSSKRPLVITHNGKSAAVVVDVSEFEALLQRLELLEDRQEAEAQIDAGQGLAHKVAHAEVVKKLSE